MKLFFMVLCAALFSYCAAAREVADASGRIFDFGAPPTAATVVPNISQEVYAIGAQDFLLGNSNYCTYPEDAKLKPKLGGLLNPDYEKIAKAAPEIFLLPLSPTGRAIARRLESVGVRPFFLNTEGLENVAKDILLLGKVFFKDAAAEKIARDFDAEIRDERGRQTGRGRKALFMFGNMAAGRGSFVGGLLDACGLKNCADAAGAPWPVLSREFIVSAAPEIIFAEVSSSADESEIMRRFKSDPAWASTPAVKNSRICFINRDIATIPSPRVLEALRIMREFCAKN